jgi:hypothetical protein
MRVDRVDAVVFRRDVRHIVLAFALGRLMREYKRLGIHLIVEYRRGEQLKFRTADIRLSQRFFIGVPADAKIVVMISGDVGLLRRSAARECERNRRHCYGARY